MTQDAQQAIADLLDAIHAAYWAACDDRGAAVDPEILGAPDGLLDDAYDTAMRVEDLAKAQGITWQEARQFF